MWHGETIMAILVLGFVGTALAYLLFFELIQRAGANYATLVTYLVPPIALAYGAIFLGERFGAAAFGALALILVGVALATGSVRFAAFRAARAEAREVREARLRVRRRPVARSSATGSSKAKMLPWCGAGSTQMRPCMEATSWRQMYRPSPLPPTP